MKNLLNCLRNEIWFKYVVSGLLTQPCGITTSLAKLP